MVMVMVMVWLWHGYDHGYDYVCGLAMVRHSLFMVRLGYGMVLVWYVFSYGMLMILVLVW